MNRNLRGMRLTSRQARAAIAIFGVIWFLGCGVPNLDPPECIASRSTIREFYSFHFGNEMRFSSEGLMLRERFLTPSLLERARSSREGIDPFTTGDADLPKAFRPGECRVLGPGRTQFDLLLFWKDDIRSEQREIKVEAEKTENGWLIDKIEN